MWNGGGRNSGGAYRFVDMVKVSDLSSAEVYNMEFPADFLYPNGNKKLLIVFVLGAKLGGSSGSPSVSLEGFSSTGSFDSGILFGANGTAGSFGAREFDNSTVNSIRDSAAGGVIDVEVDFLVDTMEECHAILVGMEKIDQTTSNDLEDTDIQTDYFVPIGGATQTLTATGATGQIGMGVIAGVDNGLAASNTILKGPTQRDTFLENDSDVRGKLAVWVDEVISTSPEDYAYGYEDTTGSHTYDQVVWRLYSMNEG